MNWIIDTDPGIDDAAAIITALRAGLDVVGITAVHGNGPLEHTLRNALTLVELVQAAVPVYRGADQAFLEPPRHATHVHGSDALGDAALSPPGGRVARGHAAQFIPAAARKHRGNLSVLALGPLTNLALALAQDRSIARMIRHVVIMGGTSQGKGNTTMAAEFNFAADPEAAAIVLGAGLPITLVPWETTVDALVPERVLARLERSPAPLAAAFLRIGAQLRRVTQEYLGVKGLLLCDLVAAAVALDPSIVTHQVRMHVAVETGGALARGLTVLDHYGLSGREPNATVCLGVDAERVAQLLVSALTQSPGGRVAGLD